MSNEIEDYLREVENIEPLTTEEEEALWETLERGGAAKKRLVETHLRLVVPIARQYEGQGLLLVDLVQEGNLGLVRAVEQFDRAKGGGFAPFASKQIEAAIVSAIARPPNAPLG